MTDDQLRALRIAKIILVNAFPLTGHFLFGWGLVEVALVYIIETISIFFVFFVYSYFIAKKTRYPFGFALVQLFFIIPFLGGFMWVYFIIVFSIFEPELVAQKEFIDIIVGRLTNFHLFEVVLCFIAIEAISFAIKANTVVKVKTIWYNVRKFLFVHFFIVISLFIFAILPASILTQIGFLVLFKILLDYAIDDEEFFKKVKDKVKSNQLFNRISGNED